MYNVETIKRGLLIQICEQYWCQVEYSAKDNSYTFDNGVSKWCTYNIDDALWSWIDTMIDTDEERAKYDLPPLWAFEIDFIQSHSKK